MAGAGGKDAVVRAPLALGALVWVVGLSAIPPATSLTSTPWLLAAPYLVVFFAGVPLAWLLVAQGKFQRPAVWVLRAVTIPGSALLVLASHGNGPLFTLWALHFLALAGVCSAILRSARLALWLWAIPALWVALWSWASIPAMLLGARALAGEAGFRVFLTDGARGYTEDFPWWDMRGMAFAARYDPSTGYAPHHAVLVIGESEAFYYWSKTGFRWDATPDGRLREQDRLEPLLNAPAPRGSPPLP